MSTWSALWEARHGRQIRFAVEWVKALASIFGVDFDGLAGSATPYLLPGYALTPHWHHEASQR